jgi:hypothetical protein
VNLALDLGAAELLAPDPVRVEDVPGQLRTLNPAGEYLAVHAGESMDPLLYTTLPENADGVHNHFQGIQRLSSGRHIVVSGSNWQPGPRGGEIYIAELGSRCAEGPWLSNLTFSKEPPPKDRIVTAITVDSLHWHAGGMDVLGPILAVPLENNDRPWLERLVTGSGRPRAPEASEVCFFDLTDPVSPRFFRGPDQRIVRPGFKGGACALTRLPNGHYLCGMWSDSDSGPMRLDLYLSESPVFDGRFRQSPGAVSTWVPDNTNTDCRAFFFQTINFLHDTDGRLYLAGFCQDGKTHCCELYTFDIPNAHRPPAAGKGIDPPIVRRVRPRVSVHCGNAHCDMRGSGSAFVTAGGINVYSLAQYRGRKTGDVVRFSEFRRPLAAVAEASPATAWVELFDKPGLQGATLALRDLEATGTLPDYRDVRVHARHFEGRVRSARYQIPAGWRYVLYRKRHFKDPLIALGGTGGVEHEPNFDALRIGGQASSSRLERNPAT